MIQNNYIKNKKILIVGLSKSGYNIAKLLANANDITLTDKSNEDKAKIDELTSLGVNFIKSDHQEELLDTSYDILIRNPGVDPHNEVIKKAKRLNIPITNEVEIAYHFIPKTCKIIAITGSNGKTTTTTMIYEILQKMGEKVILGGNIGYPLSEIINKVEDDSILVLEISDHQLYDCVDFKPNIAVLTNLCPTHLDFHDNYGNYINVKKKIFKNQNLNDIAIINYGNEDSLKITNDIRPKKLYFNGVNAHIVNDFIFVNGKPIININNIKIKGYHNYENIMACLLVINEFGLNNKIIEEYYANFKGVEHRLEYVDTINGVAYYNDSKATNPTSTYIAINSFKDNIHLILGGFERKQDFNELNDVINKVKMIYAIGETEDRVYEYAISKHIPCTKCATLNNAMEKIYNNVKEKDVVLLSPASASWDQYKKFEDRGSEFKKLVKSFK